MPAVFLSNLLLFPADDCGMHRSGTQTFPCLLAIAFQSRRREEKQHLLDACSFCLGPLSNTCFCLEMLAPNRKQPSYCVLQLIAPGFRIAAVKRQFSFCCCVGETEQPERQSVYMWVPGCISFACVLMIICVEGFLFSFV